MKTLTIFLFVLILVVLLAMLVIIMLGSYISDAKSQERFDKSGFKIDNR